MVENIQLFQGYLKMKEDKPKKMMIETPVPEERPISFSLTQSLLQKSVRRSQGMISAKAMKEMLIQDENKTLRRMLIVVLEDAFLHPNYGILGTMYQQGVGHKRKLTPEEKDMLVQMAFDIGSVNFRDVWVDEDSKFMDNEEVKIGLENRVDNLPKLAKLPEKEQEIIEAIRYRAFAGGMMGDRVMMWNYYCLWLNRFASGEWTYNKLKAMWRMSEITFDSVEGLKREDILPEAADFHCCPLLKILMRKDYVNKLLDEYDPALINAEYQTREDALGDVLWRQHSSFNNKIEIDSGKIRDWYAKGLGKTKNRLDEEKIYARTKDDVYGIANWFIGKTVKL